MAHLVHVDEVRVAQQAREARLAAQLEPDRPLGALHLQRDLTPDAARDLLQGAMHIPAGPSTQELEHHVATDPLQAIHRSMVRPSPTARSTSRSRAARGS